MLCSFLVNFINANLKLVVPVVLVGLIVLGGGGYYLYQNLQRQPLASPQQAQEEVKRLVAEVGKLIDLPTGEDPTVATVTDISKLSDQPFFQKAKNGDKVLIYTQAKKAILYDPQAKKILDVAPINLGTPAAELASPKPSGTPSPKPTPSPSPE